MTFSSSVNINAFPQAYPSRALLNEVIALFVYVYKKYCTHTVLCTELWNCKYFINIFQIIVLYSHSISFIQFYTFFYSFILCMLTRINYGYEEEMRKKKCLPFSETRDRWIKSVLKVLLKREINDKTVLCRRHWPEETEMEMIKTFGVPTHLPFSRE